FVNMYQGNNTTKEFEFWKDRLNEVDMVSGTASTLTEYGEAGMGESKYGRPILDRNLTYQTPLDEALRCGLISFDSTIRSNLSVGMPLDMLVYHKDSLEAPARQRITSDDAYYVQIRRQWSDGLKRLLAELPAPPYN
ncbi:MAG: hypothetical protein ABS956_21240, partial [Pseudomonas sp.]